MKKPRLRSAASSNLIWNGDRRLTVYSNVHLPGPGPRHHLADSLRRIQHYRRDCIAAGRILDPAAYGLRLSTPSSGAFLLPADLECLKPADSLEGPL